MADLEVLLFEHDPIGLAGMGAPADEYHAEAETITLRLPEAASVDDLRSIVHEEFVRWFGDETAGGRERYEAAAEAIWSRHGPRA